jgi:hypothetical protein
MDERLARTVLGAVARGDDRADSDVDVLIKLDRERAMGIFDYARVKLYINEIAGGSGDIVNRRVLKPMLRENVFRDAVDVF